MIGWERLLQVLRVLEVAHQEKVSAASLIVAGIVIAKRANNPTDRELAKLLGELMSDALEVEASLPEKAMKAEKAKDGS